MKRPILVATFAALSALALTNLAAASEPLQVKNAETLTATVVSVDAATRMVTLKGPSGRTETLEVAPEVRNLAQVKAGDQVVVRYYESLAADIRKKGAAAPTNVKESGVAAAAPAGTRPGAVVGNTVNSTVVIESVDRTANTVTFRNEDGITHTVAVKKPESQKFIAGLKKGDQVDISYSQALAVSVEPSP
ncbi:MAG TPA: hypothetical protein PKE27_13040 [Povalibacter sp.]|uniref:hypothetical protein n=1 Tax=Povalibacter sp. TaxID=1962978 RepID=UPI002B8FC1A2|nr:hypothetical protein [Povalibacter sp.]HMN45502.1 hypothetical protein [Povalibacter sp.]